MLFFHYIMFLCSVNVECCPWASVCCDQETIVLFSGCLMLLSLAHHARFKAGSVIAIDQLIDKAAGHLGFLLILVKHTH